MPNPPPEMLPNLFIPGAARCGTSTMHAHLNRHPDVFMSEPKEPHYLCRRDKGLDDYRRLFHAAGGHKYRGESSTGYLLLQEVIGKIQQFMPDSRFILMFRNPVDRAWSHYWHIRGGSGAERAPFREAFLRSQHEPLGYAMYNRHYHQTGMYARWLQNYLDAFGSDRVHVVILEELDAEPAAVLRQVCEFLEIPDFESAEDLHLNRSRITRFPLILRVYASLRRLASNTVLKPLPNRAYAQVRSGNRLVGGRLRRLLGATPPPRLPAEDRPWLADSYRDDVARLREMISKPLAAWTDFPS